MAGIVREVLGSKPGDGSEAAPVRIDRIIEEAVRTFEGRAAESGVVITSSCRTENMPAVRGSQLYQVCCNLIKNALDAMPTGGMLTIHAAVVGDGMVLRLEDTGAGLPDGTARIFDPFHTTRNAIGGTGLGLAICKQFVERMGGSITAGQRDGGGAVFSVRIPLERCVRV